MTVSDSGDSGCFSLSNPSSVLFDYYVGEDNQFAQCEPSRIWWTASTVQGYCIGPDILILNIIDKIS